MLVVRTLETPRLKVAPFALEDGMCLAVRGPSGAGKSQLLRALADLDPNHGEIELDGKARAAMPAPRWRRQVVYVPAESGWWAEDVGTHFEDPAAAAPLAARLQLAPDWPAWPIARLSTGERQRLALLRALSLGPRVLLLDEPTSGLDAANIEAAEKLLMEACAGGASLLIVTHDAAQARRLAKGDLPVEAGEVRAPIWIS